MSRAATMEAVQQLPALRKSVFTRSHGAPRKASVQLRATSRRRMTAIALERNRAMPVGGRLPIEQQRGRRADRKRGSSECSIAFTNRRGRILVSEADCSCVADPEMVICI